MHGCSKLRSGKRLRRKTEDGRPKTEDGRRKDEGKMKELTYSIMYKMKLIGKLFLIVSLAYSSKLSSQPAYLTGTGQSSIEPDQTLISLHLGGYGAPRDGRFSLQWIEKGSVPDATALAGITNRLYIVSGNDILNMVPSESVPVWKSVGKAEKIISLAGLNEKLYAINTAGDLLVTNTQGKNQMEQHRISE